MKDDDKPVPSEAAVTAQPPGQARPGAARPLAEAVQAAPGEPAAAGARPDAIQAAPPRPEGGQDQPRKPSLKRRVLIGVAALFVCYLLGAALGLVPCSYSYSRVAGRGVTVISYHPSVKLVTSREVTRIETGGQLVIVRDDTIDLGDGRTMPIPPWCQDVRVSVRGRSVSVTFSAT